MVRVTVCEAVRSYFLLLGLVLAPEGRRLAKMGGGDTRPWIPLQPPDRRSLRTRSITRRRTTARSVHDARARLFQLEYAVLFALADEHCKAQPTERPGSFESVCDVEHLALRPARRLELLQAFLVLLKRRLHGLPPGPGGPC